MKTAEVSRSTNHFGGCPLPRHRLRNGRLNQTAYSLFLFIQKTARQASTKENNGKGYPLILLRCQGRHLNLVDGTEDNFWSGKKSGALDSSGSYRIAWMKWENQKIPIKMEAGQDGNYFDIDVSDGAASVGGEFKGLLNANSFSICPSEESPSSKCRNFSGVNFDKAVSYVCNRK